MSDNRATANTGHRCKRHTVRQALQAEPNDHAVDLCMHAAGCFLYNTVSGTVSACSHTPEGMPIANSRIGGAMG